VFEALSMRDKWRTALERLMDYWYWRGVATAARIDEFRSRVVTPPVEVTIDLLGGLERAEGELDRVRPQSLRLTIGSELIGEMPPVPGAEPLRGVHLRPLLLKVFAQETAAAAMRAGLLPEVLRECTEAVSGDARRLSCAGTDQAA
jgi:hypothetical protein